MGVSCRIFLVDQNDALYRVTNTRFDQMLRDPDHRLPRLAGQRVRIAEALVELANRAPIGLLRLTFSILTFDEEGRVDRSTFERQQFARVEMAFSGMIPVWEHRSAAVVDASTRFLEQGGRWTPSARLARAIEGAALGRTKCPRL